MTMGFSTIFKVLGILLTGLVIVTILRALTIQDLVKFSKFPRKSDNFLTKDSEVGAYAERLAASLRIRTVSYNADQLDRGDFIKLHQFLEDSFPLVHSSPNISREFINTYSLLYKISGSNTELKPYLLAAHLDVVPANGSWSVNPFDGVIKDGVIYGRGATDDKHSVMGILEALEYLLREGFEPQRTFYIAFGHDEELTGQQGAHVIGQTLSQRSVDLDFVLDEGFYYLKDLVTGVTSYPVAMIGISEKGWLELELSTAMPPGHCSIPPLESALGVLAKGVANLEANRHPSMFGKGPEYDMFSSIAPYADPFYRYLFANLWLFQPLFVRVLSQKPVTDSFHRTATAITIFQSGYKNNVIPGSAKAIVNHRVHPAQTLEDVLAHDKKAIGDERVEIRVRKYIPPMPISPYGEEEEIYRLIGDTALQICPDCAVAPGISPANTDLKHYVKLTKKLYRFSPAFVDPITLPGLHGDDERLSVRDYKKVIDFYLKFILNADDYHLFLKKKDEL
ncbi:hypothetical protein QYM36_006049 [Artemia franciscana]|uniref:Peptidase M20 dimerisation domain-containing protein n=1 Tax=Artemia franciscana TaxID=6661 RepID=A0AA88LES6_ARTSF|nr:hypothetical protein QYM36_006049 [Artemia franciscana]